MVGLGQGLSLQGWVSHDSLEGRVGQLVEMTSVGWGLYHLVWQELKLLAGLCALVALYPEGEATPIQ